MIDLGRPATPALPPNPKVAIVGDSVIAGLGVHGRSYARIAADELEASNVLRLARSTHTVLHAVGHLSRLREYEPDLVIVAVGGSDSLVHAGRGAQKLLDRFAPKSWQGIEGLEPRPWLSGEAAERRRQKITMGAKLVLKHIGIRLTGGYRRVPLTDFMPALSELVAGLDGLGCTVVMVGLPQLDDRLWPRSNASIDEYATATRTILAPYPGIVYLDPRPYVDRWSDYGIDHAHFTESGHQKVAEALLTTLLPFHQSTGEQASSIEALTADDLS